MFSLGTGEELLHTSIQLDCFSVSRLQTSSPVTLMNNVLHSSLKISSLTSEHKSKTACVENLTACSLLQYCIIPADSPSHLSNAFSPFAFIFILDLFHSAYRFHRNTRPPPHCSIITPLLAYLSNAFSPFQLSVSTCSPACLNVYTNMG
jgi:hypothetical protein